MATDKTKQSQATTSVSEYLASIDDEQTVKDSEVLIDMMHRISSHEPQLSNVATVGFGSYRFKYDSGREGDGHAIGFYPRKGKITIYLMDGTARYLDLLARLGKHNRSRVCITIKQLSDIDLSVLEQIVQQSYDYVMSQDGRMQRAVE